MLHVSVQQRYFDAIKAGTKTVEGRLNSPKFKDLAAGTFITFICADNREQLVCIVQNVQVYSTFEAMLVAQGISNMLPDIDSLPVAVAMYESFPGYRENVTKMGALAIKIKVLHET